MKRPFWPMCLSLSLFLLFGCYQARNESIRLMSEGLKVAKGGSISSGLKLLAKAAEVDPTNHRALYYQGMLSVKRLGEMERGAQFLEAAIKIKDTNYEYFYHLGFAYYRLVELKIPSRPIKERLRSSLITQRACSVLVPL